MDVNVGFSPHYCFLISQQKINPGGPKSSATWKRPWIKTNSEEIWVDISLNYRSCKAIPRNKVIYGKYIIEFSWGPPGQLLLLLGLVANWHKNDFLLKCKENNKNYMILISELEEHKWLWVIQGPQGRKWWCNANWTMNYYSYADTQALLASKCMYKVTLCSCHLKKKNLTCWLIIRHVKGNDGVMEHFHFCFQSSQVYDMLSCLKCWECRG